MKDCLRPSEALIIMRPMPTLKHLGGWAMLSSPPMLPFSVRGNTNTSTCKVSLWFGIKALKLSNQRVWGTWVPCAVRRRSVRYDEEDDEDEEYGHNEQIASLELYSQSAKGEALIVHAVVDEEEVEVLIFKVSFIQFHSFGVQGQ